MPQTVKAMKAFSPMKGAIANGRLAQTPIRKVPVNAVSIVAAIAASKGIPAETSIDGFTTMIYAIAKNVINPAYASVFTVVLCSSR